MSFQRVPPNGELMITNQSNSTIYSCGLAKREQTVGEYVEAKIASTAKELTELSSALRDMPDAVRDMPRSQFYQISRFL